MRDRRCAPVLELRAATFDDEPDHGLRDGATRAAWLELLMEHLPPAPARVAAREKARLHGVEAVFERGDASCPPYDPGSFDVVLSRHVLWAMSASADVLQRWVDLLRPGGRLVLIEGFWSTGAGLRASECAQLLSSLGRRVAVHELEDEILWGKPITDERYLAISEG